MSISCVIYSEQSITVLVFFFRSDAPLLPNSAKILKENYLQISILMCFTVYPFLSLEIWPVVNQKLVNWLQTYVQRGSV